MLSEMREAVSGYGRLRLVQSWGASTHLKVGALCSHSCRPTDSEPLGRAALTHRGTALAEELGMRPLVAHCYLGLGTVYRRTAKREQGHERLTTATTTYREIDMRFWLEHAATEMGA